ncbi:putative heavy-metal-binding-domain-containing protein [Hypoxylon trugodes]|uniref:putative heavy-metal-binding-domain-containing protein n=1 Tax=Hypoxylon trugodes TaxID=326681 RepID=UPI0021980DC7|nr:putative heavy-metal-binding-domain-containing protein [Hypoxylon trugodes]KAI1384249.1 putative heavy-metal-binding-domain-containing protein [Hypoxylon trugodes]
MLTNRRSTFMIPPNQNGRATSYQPGAPPTLGSAKPESEPHCAAPSLLTSTTPNLPGYRIAKVLGAVFGSTTYALKDTKALLKAAAAGSEVKSLTHIMYNARDQAVERMTRDCVARGANAVIAVAFEEKEVLGFVQVSVSGTAVYVEREKVAENPFTPE